MTMKLKSLEIIKDLTRPFNNEFDLYRSTKFKTPYGTAKKMVNFSDRKITYTLLLNSADTFTVQYNNRGEYYVTYYCPFTPSLVMSDVSALDEQIKTLTTCRAFCLLVEDLSPDDDILWSIGKWDKKSLEEAGYGEITNLV